VKKLLFMEVEIVKRFLFLIKLLCPLVPILTAGFFMASSGYAEISTNGDVDPSDPSSWTIFTYAYIGDEDEGTLTITNDTVINAIAYLGYSSGAYGTAIVDGEGSEWTHDWHIYVGYKGTGELSISNGGTVASYYADLGYSSGSYGTVSVDGENSTWTNGNYIIVGNYGTGELNITNGGIVSSRTAYSGPAYIGNREGSSGKVSVDGDGSTWTNNGELLVGSKGTGVLSITNGGLVSNDGATLGGSSGSSGKVIVDGDASSWANSGNLYVGWDGTGELSITNGGSVSNGTSYIGYEEGSSGEVTVDGTGSTWTSSGNLYVGKDGSGVLNILNNAMVSVSEDTIVGESGSIDFGDNGGTLSTVTLYVGESQLSGFGTVNAHGIVTDADILFDSSHDTMQSIDNVTIDLTLDGSGDLGVGYLGQGTLTITDGVAIESTTGYLGYNSNSTGTAIVEGEGSSWANSEDLYVGMEGTGELSITNGGSVSNNIAYLGYSEGSVGSVTVNGEGTKWTNKYLRVGHYGTGTMTISNGGKVIASGGNVAIGKNEGSNGTVTVDGEGSLLGITYWLEVGASGTGTLSITNGGSVRNYYNSAYIGSSAGSSGTVIVDGEDSTWDANTGLYIGLRGTGTLSITNGGTVTNSYYYGYASIGSSAGSSGMVLVDGEGSTWTLNDYFNYSEYDWEEYYSELNVGGGGTGSLTITNGGAVTDSYGYVGSSSGATGTVTVDGEGSTWTNRYDLYVGSSGIGTLSVTDGGLVSASYVSINSSSTVTLDVNSTLKVGTEDGTIANDGIVRLVASAGADSGTYTPISYGTMDGDGTVQALGGIWNADAHTITVYDAVTAQNSGGAIASLDLSLNQRALITDSCTGKSAGASFLGSAESARITFTATGVTDDELLADLIAKADEDVLSAWNLSAEDYDSEIYLSLFAGSAEDILDLTIWYLLNGVWTEYDATDLSFDGTYASFTVTDLGTYAVTAISSVPVPETLCLLAAGVLGMAGLNRKRRE
jgi:fibronectin-binding autotransporter adhesin